VQVVANRYPLSLPARDVIDGILILRMLFPGFFLASFRPLRILKYIAGLLMGAINFARLCFLFGRERPDVVNIHFLGSQAPFVLMACKLLHIPCVVSLHGDDVEGLPYRTRIDYWLFQRVLSSADHVTACSAYLLNQAREQVPGIRNKATVTWNGIRVEEYEGIRPHSHPRPYLFAAGRLVPKKGFDLLLRAYSQLLNTGLQMDLILAGDGPEKENLVKQAKELSLPILVRNSHIRIRDKQNLLTNNLLTFWGRASREEMKRLMAECKVFVIPSRLEPFGIVALEAFTSGKRVVASRIGGLAEIVKEEWGGVLVDPDSPSEIAKGIHKALSEVTGNINFDPSEHSWNRAASGYLCAYETVLKSSGDSQVEM